MAGNQLVAYASNLSAGQTLTLQGADVNLQSGLNASSASEQSSSSHGGLSIGPHVTGINPKTKGTQDQQNTTLVATTLDAQNIDIKATGDTGTNGNITLAGVQAKTPGKLSLDAGADGTLNLNLVSTTQYLAHTSSSGDEIYGKSRDQGSNAETAHYNQLEVGSLSVNAGHVNVQIARTAAEVKAEQAVAAQKAAAEKAAVAAAVEKAAAEKEAATTVASAAGMVDSDSGSSGINSNSGGPSATTLTSHILAVAPATATATSTTTATSTPTTTATSILTKAPTTPPPTLQEKAQLLAQQPGMSYLNQLINDPQTSSKIDWSAVELAQKNWDYKHQGLTQAGSLIVAIVVTIVTAGSGTAAALETTVTTATGSAAMGTAAVAGMSTLASQAAVSLINNQGDIGKTLHDLGSSENVKGLVTSMVTAGVLQGLDKTLEIGGVKLSDISAKSPFMDQLSKNLINGVASTAISSAITGGSLEDGLKAGLTSALLSTAASQGAYAIGGLADEGTLNAFTHQVAHAVLGCAVGAGSASSSGGSSSNGCAAGAVGAVVGELSAQAYDPNLERSNTVQVSQLMSAVVVAALGGDAQAVNIAAAAGANAAENNQLGTIARMVTAAAEFAKSGAGALSQSGILALQRCLAIPSCNTAVTYVLPAGSMAWLLGQTSNVAVQPSLADLIPTGYGSGVQPTVPNTAVNVPVLTAGTQGGTSTNVQTNPTGTVGGTQLDITSTGTTTASGGYAAGVQPAQSNLMLSSDASGGGSNQPVYVPSPKHDPVSGWGTPMDLSDTTAQQVLNDSVQGGKQRYGFTDGKIYEFQPDNVGGWHGYPIPGTEAPIDVLRGLRDSGRITNAEFNQLRRGK